MKMKVSSAWANKKINCTLSGILENCGGCCTHGSKYWPLSAAYIKETNSCSHLVNNKCEFDETQRPIVCLIYPFVFNKSNTLVIQRNAFQVCGKNFNCGTTTILENLKDCFVGMFGIETYTAMLDSVKSGIDYEFETSEEFEKQWKRELYWIENNIDPTARSIE